VPPSAHHVAAVAVLVLHEGRVLALRRAPDAEAAPGVWEALSGRIEPGEAPRATARREVREEAGLDVAVEARPWTAYAATRAGEPMIVIVYRAVPHDVPEVVRSHEHDAHAWLDADAFAAHSPIAPLVDAVRTALAAAPPDPSAAPTERPAGRRAR